MGTTTGGLPYPEPTDLLANVDLAIKALAEALIGTPSTSLVGIVNAAGWTVNSVRSVKLGTRFQWLDVVITRNAGAAVITASASGNIGDTDMGTLAAAMRPARRQWLSGHRSTLGVWQVALESTGVLLLAAGPPNAVINPGDTVQVVGLVEIL